MSTGLGTPNGMVVGHRPRRRATSYELRTIETVARGYLNTMQELKKKNKKDGVDDR